MLTRELHLDGVKMNHYAKYLPQTTDCCTQPAKMVGKIHANMAIVDIRLRPGVALVSYFEYTSCWRRLCLADYRQT